MWRIISVDHSIAGFIGSALASLLVFLKNGEVCERLFRWRKLLFSIACGFTASTAHASSHVDQYSKGFSVVLNLVCFALART